MNRFYSVVKLVSYLISSPSDLYSRIRLGCGKTTLVQYLAQKTGKFIEIFERKKQRICFFTGNRLHVVNLSQQSDAVDLLGGYKPFDPLLLLKQIYRDFSHEQTNDQYIEEVQVKGIGGIFFSKFWLLRNQFKRNDIKKLFD